MFAVCHACYSLEFGSDDYVNQIVNSSNSIKYIIPQNYFGESVSLYFKDCLLFTLQHKANYKTQIDFEWWNISIVKYRWKSDFT